MRALAGGEVRGGLGRRLNGGRREREGEKPMNTLTGRFTGTGNKTQLLCQSMQERGARAPSTAGEEFAMLNTLVVMGSESTATHSKTLVWGSFRSGGGHRQDAGSWASLLRGGGPDGCTGTDRRSQAGPEIKQTREQKDGWLQRTHAVNFINSPSLLKGPHEVRFLILFTHEETGSQGMRELGHSHTTGGRQNQDEMPDGPEARLDSVAQNSSWHVQRGRGMGLEAPDFWVGGGGAGLSTLASNEPPTVPRADTRSPGLC